MFLGASTGGIWRSTNFTAAQPTWSPRTDFVALTGQQPFNLASGLGAGAIDVGCIAVDPNNPRTIYVGTGAAINSVSSRYGTGILISTDGGDTFAILSKGPVGANGLPAFYRHSISKIIIDPNNSNVLYAAVTNWAENSGTPQERGIYKSSDGGTAWTKITDATRIGNNIYVTDLEFTRPNNTSITLFAAVYGSGIWRSSNDGETWTQPMNSGAPTANIGVMKLAADHTVGNTTVYAAYASTAAAQSGIAFAYKTPNDGTNWTNMAAPIINTEVGRHIALGVEQGANGRVYLGGVKTNFTNGIAEYTPAQPAWRWIGAGTNDIVPHTDFHAFAIQGTTVYAGNDGGIWRYNREPNPGPPDINTRLGTWNDLNTAPANTPIDQKLQTNQVFSVAVQPGNANFLLEASQDNTFARSVDGGATWNTIAGDDGMGVWFDPANPNTAYALEQFGKLSRTYNVNANTESTIDWAIIRGPGAGPNVSFPFVSAFAINPGDSRRILLGSVDALYESVDRGANWTLKSPTGQGALDATEITSVAYAPNQNGNQLAWGNVIYITYGDGKVFRTDNDGGNGTAANWTLLAAPWGNTKPISRIIADPLHPGVAYVSINTLDVAQIWRTTDSGGSWTSISTGMANIPAKTLLLDTAAALTTLYAGTDVGVYQGTLSQNTWTWIRYDQGLPYVQVTDLQIRDGVLFAASFGRGVWKCPPFVGPNPPMQPQLLSGDSTLSAIDQTLLLPVGSDGMADPDALVPYVFSNAAGPFETNVILFQQVDGGNDLIDTATLAYAVASGSNPLEEIFALPDPFSPADAIFHV